MYTQYTFQDWELTPEFQRPDMLLDVVRSYKASDDFLHALEAADYFAGANRAVGQKVMLRPVAYPCSSYDGVKTIIENKEIVGARVYSNFFFRFVTQQNQFLLGNGVTLDDEATKARLGLGFDKALEALGEKALVAGVAWGYWNEDHLEVIEAARDALSGFVALVDEETSAPRLGVQFWQIDVQRPMYIRLFEEDGVSVWRYKDNALTEVQPKRAYRLRIARDAAGVMIMGGSNYGALPLVPLYANTEQRSELTPSIKSKIDAYDRISSDFVDNLDRANDVYWVINNFGGSMREMAEMIRQINELRMIANISDGTGVNSTAEPHAFEVPYEARRTALDLLEKALYQDYMALSMDELTGGSLTNVAIQAAMTNLNLKCDRYEWQCFKFVQQVLALIGIRTENIRFIRQEIVNRSETVQDIGMMRDYIDDQTALELNPYILQEQVPEIMERAAAEKLSRVQTPGLMAAMSEVEAEDEEEQDAGKG